MLFDGAEGRPLAALLGGRRGQDPGRTVTINGHEVALFVAPEDPDQMAWMDCPEDADVILTLATVDPALGAEHISTSVSDVVVMVRAGAASFVHLDTVGQLLRQALIGVRSAILIDSDRDDHSSGLVVGYAAPEDATTDHTQRAVKAVRP